MCFTSGTLTPRPCIGNTGSNTPGFETNGDYNPETTALWRTKNLLLKCSCRDSLALGHSEKILFWKVPKLIWRRPSFKVSSREAGTRCDSLQVWRHQKEQYTWPFLTSYLLIWLAPFWNIPSNLLAPESMLNWVSHPFLHHGCVPQSGQTRAPPTHMLQLLEVRAPSTFAPQMWTHHSRQVELTQGIDFEHLALVTRREE